MEKIEFLWAAFKPMQKTMTEHNLKSSLHKCLLEGKHSEELICPSQT